MAPSAAQETVSLPSGGLLTLPPTRPGARHFSGLPSTRPSFNPHSSRSGSVQRILSAVPAPALSHSADFLWGRAPPIECSSLSVAILGSACSQEVVLCVLENRSPSPSPAETSPFPPHSGHAGSGRSQRVPFGP